MRLWNIPAKVFAGLAMIALAGAPADATTLIRSGLERLTADNEIVAHTRVVDTRSYWNVDHSFILTDVRLESVSSLKGSPRGKQFVITLMGGTVDDLTTVIVGGPELAPGSEYILFLSRQDLPGVAARLGVRDLAQGVFEIVDGVGGRRAVSQALRLPLLPDASGISEPPGGAAGFAVDDLTQRIRTLSGR